MSNQTKLLALRHKSWFRTALIVSTVVATILLAAHPELRLLLPVLDGLGLDLLVLLVGGQLLGFAVPWLELLWRRAAKPLALRAWRSFIYVSGFMGPYFDGALAVRFGPPSLRASSTVTARRRSWPPCPPTASNR